MPVQCLYNGTDKEQSSCGNRTATARRSCGRLSMCHCLSQLVCLSYAVFLFYTFEVPSQLKMISCTRLLHKFLKVHEDHTAIVRSPHCLRTRTARVSCDIRAISMYGCGDSTMTAGSPYDLRTFCLRLCTGLL